MTGSETGDEGADEGEGADKGIQNKGKKAPSKVKAGSSSSSPSYSVLAKALAEEGVLTDFNEEEFNESVEETGNPALALIAHIKKYGVDAGVEDYKNSLNTQQKEYLEALEHGVPHETISTLQRLEAEFNSITPDAIDADEDLAKRLYGQVLTIRGFSPDEIATEIADKEAVGKIKGVGKQSLNFLKGHIATVKQQEATQAATAQQAKETEATQYVTSIKTKINGLTEIIPGQKLSPKVKGQLIDALTRPIAKDPTRGTSLNLIGKKRLENPVDFDTKLAYMIITGQFEGDLKHVKANAKSAAINELDELINSGAASGTAGAGRKPALSAQKGNKQSSEEVLASLTRLMKNKKRF